MLMFASGASLSQAEFRPATFSGLTMGKSTIADVKKRFGEPKAFLENNLTGKTWMRYEDIAPVAGDVEIDAVSNSGIIQGISVDPTLRFSIEDSKRLFGSDFKIVRYAFEPCIGDETRPMFESENGFPYMVYSKLGIAIVLDSVDPTNVLFINYLHEPVGATKSRCKEGEHK
jgi:hypothetical protein